MSRIGKQPVKIPSGVTATIGAEEITINGPKGTLSQFTMPNIKVEQVNDELIVSRANEEKMSKSKHGLMRSLLSNMVDGVTNGFAKKLEINGVGYRAALQGQSLKLNVGYSHDVIYPIPEGILIAVDQNIITVSGISKQQVGQVAAEIRATRKPEPYKGKGIKYDDERIIRKSGKSGKEKTA
jgi:large subunit ribosomal protein L6